MAYYIPNPNIFRPEEIFPPWIVDQYRDKNKNINKTIWRLTDSRLLWTAVQLRGLFGKMTVNNYLWGGSNDERGYRDPIRLIDIKHFKQTGVIRASWSSFTSQHCFGRALDSTFKNYLVKDIIKYIMTNNERNEFKYIMAIEKETRWFHFDIRNFKIANQRFFIF